MSKVEIDRVTVGRGEEGHYSLGFVSKEDPAIFLLDEHKAKHVRDQLNEILRDE